MRAARFASILLLAAAAIPAASLAHEVHREVRWGRAVAVRASLADGKSLTHAEAEVYSPKDPAVPCWKGRTDRNGWLSFVPDAPGAWRVRIVDSTGHGLDTRVDVPTSLGAEDAAAAEAGSTLGLALRPVLGVAVIVAIFGALALLRRRRGR